jgi:hypothetical protein
MDADHQHLNRSISNEGKPALPGAASNVRVNQPSLARWNSGSDKGATAGSAVQQVQLKADTGLVNVGGYETTPEVRDALAKQAPEIFVAPEVRAAEAAKEADNAKDEEAARQELNRFADDAAEGVAMHISNDVDFSTQTRMLLELSRDGQPSQQTLERFAEQLHMSVDDAVQAVNAITVNTSGQLQALCNAKGVDAQAFSDYMRTHRATEMFRCVQIHTQERDLVRAWGMEVDAFKARGGKA